MGQWGWVVVLNAVFVHFVCNIFVCACSVVGGGCGIHISNDKWGTVFVFIDNGFISPCISKREACASGELPEVPMICEELM